MPRQGSRTSRSLSLDTMADAPAASASSRYLLSFISRQSLTRPRVSPLQQWALLSQRYAELLVRDLRTLVILLAVMPILGLLLRLMSDRRN